MYLLNSNEVIEVSDALERGFGIFVVPNESKEHDEYDVGINAFHSLDDMKRKINDDILVFELQIDKLDETDEEKTDKILKRLRINLDNEQIIVSNIQVQMSKCEKINAKNYIDRIKGVHTLSRKIATRKKVLHDTKQKERAILRGQIDLLRYQLLLVRKVENDKYPELTK